MYTVKKNSYACGGFQTTVCTCADCLLFGTADTYYGTVDTVRHVVVSLLIASCMLQRIPTYVRTYPLASFPPLSNLSDRDFVRFVVNDVLETESSSAFLVDGGRAKLT